MVLKIDGRDIGPGQPPYIIAELSANHNGSLERALQTIDAAYQAGADAIKLQTYTADTMTIDCDREDFPMEGGLWQSFCSAMLIRARKSDEARFFQKN